MGVSVVHISFFAIPPIGILYHSNGILKNNEASITTQNKREEIKMIDSKLKKEIQDVLGLENRSDIKVYKNMTYLGAIKDADLFIKIIKAKAMIQINFKKEIANETVYEILNVMAKYYYNNLHLFSINKSKLVASIRNCDLHLYLEKEDLFRILLNIKQALLGVTCEKYKRDKFCLCNKDQGCLYNKLMFKDKYKYISGVILTGMPELRAKNILEKILFDLKC